MVTQVAQLEPQHSCLNPRPDLNIQRRQPVAEWNLAVASDILADSQRHDCVSIDTIRI